MATTRLYFLGQSRKVDLPTRGNRAAPQILIRLVILTSVALCASGCAFNVAYNPSFLPPPPAVTKVEGKVLITMTEEQEQWVYSGHPTSFTGGGSKLTIPLGSITKQIALNVFGTYFQQAEASQDMEQAASYRIVVNPVVEHFEYSYNSLKNLGFAITPQVKIDLHVTLYNSEGKEMFSRTYSSGEKEGSAYMVSGSPDERVNRLVHETLFDLMTQAAQDSQKSAFPK